MDTDETGHGHERNWARTQARLGTNTNGLGTDEHGMSGLGTGTGGLDTSTGELGTDELCPNVTSTH